MAADNTSYERLLERPGPSSPSSESARNKHLHIDEVPERESPLRECGRCVRSQLASMCARHTLARRLPITQWLPRYTLSLFLHDVMAGLTVGMTAIPQGIAYAVVAGLEPQYGLYSGFMGSFVYVLFGSTKDITVGPTAIMALMTQTYVLSYGADFAVLLTFLSGCVITLFGLLQLGFVVDFISMPVTVGFTTAAAITIASSQLKGLFGLKGSTDKFMDSIVNFFERIHEAQLWDSVLGISTIVALLLLQKLTVFRVKGNPPGQTISTFRRVWGNTLWLLSLARNAIVVFFGVGLAYVLFLNGHSPFTLTGKIGEGFPPIGLPPFSTVFRNETYSFVEMTSALGSSLIAIPLISILESIAIAKAFSKGKAVDATQEMIALGLGNMLGSFVRSMPVTGSFTRTAVNNASGVRTPAGGIFTGLLVMGALGLLTSTFYYIPKATLAGLIMTAMFSMIDYEVVSLLWRTKRIDLIPLGATFVFCLALGLEYGMIVGITVNLLILLYHSARPPVNMKWVVVNGCNVLLVTPAQSLAFPSAEYVREVIVADCNEHRDESQQSAVVIDGVNLFNIDSTVAKVIKLLSEDLKVLEVPIFLWRWSLPVTQTLLGIDPKMKPLFRNATTLDLVLSLENRVRHESEGLMDEDTAVSMMNGGQHVP
ncbi:sodium-independent sulfate anion transporter-like isoform X2 [Thrips palmi]|uniref:Sodium-independent sulfate anion transporter-like isoform X2 n=1 Tax=Thrips palmi TaxID=161013 RepID=A0A6P8ZP25_THRPL|nr:sodium-independent sulfate anion transporter-like isoform X2 [Thrips palmi]